MPTRRLVVLFAVFLASVAFAISGLIKFRSHSKVRHDALIFAEVFRFDPQAVEPKDHQKAQQVVTCTITNLWADVTDAVPAKGADAEAVAYENDINATYAQRVMDLASRWDYESVPIPRIYLERNHWRVGVENWSCPRF